MKAGSSSCSASDRKFSSQVIQIMSIHMRKLKIMFTYLNASIMRFVDQKFHIHVASNTRHGVRGA